MTALDRLRRELADVNTDGAAIGGVGVTDLTRTLDVWFDNFYSDLAVRRALQERHAQVAGRLGES
ncbi:MAG TPA: hypothetical protein VGK78_09705 [Nocardioides sp.]|uniref:hypothetical protein n=1 Tax=Nocardioides sp. TaxID=35761 RepID=UPI002F404682